MFDRIHDALGVSDQRPLCFSQSNSIAIFLLDLPATLGCLWQEQDLFLDVGGEVEEGEDLGQAGGGDVGVFGEGGLVGDLAGAEEFVAVDRQGHEAADAGNFAWRGIGGGAGVELLAAVLAAGGVELAGDGE